MTVDLCNIVSTGLSVGSNTLCEATCKFLLSNVVLTI